MSDKSTDRQNVINISSSPVGTSAAVLSKKRVQVVASILFLALTCYFAYAYWSKPFSICKIHDEHCKTLQDKQQLSSIFKITFRIIMSLLILLQVLHLLKFNVTPFLATIGVAIAAAGFALQQPIQDYVNGMIFAMSERWQIGDTVYILVHGQTEKRGPYRIKELLMFGIEFEDLDGQTVYYRYGVLDGFEKYAA